MLKTSVLLILEIPPVATNEFFFEKKAKVFILDVTAETYDKSVEFNKSSVNSVTSVQFAFVGDSEPLGVRLIKLESTGAFCDVFKDING